MLKRCLQSSASCIADVYKNRYWSNVSTIDILWCLNSFTTSETFSFLLSFNRWIMISRAMNVPVRPTPPLSKSVISLLIKFSQDHKIQLPSVNHDRPIDLLFLIPNCSAEFNQLCCIWRNPMMRPRNKVEMVHCVLDVILKSNKTLSQRILNVLSCSTISTSKIDLMWAPWKDSFLKVTLMFRNVSFSPRSGKYLLHFSASLSTRDVNITIESTLCWRIIRQKS